MTEAAAEIARAAARSWLAPLIDTACDRLAFVLQSLFDLAMERCRYQDSKCTIWMPVGFISLPTITWLLLILKLILTIFYD